MLLEMASRIAGVRLARSLLETVRETCPDVLPDAVGKLLGRGGQGEAYELGPDRVLKVGIVKSLEQAKSMMSKLDRVQSKDQDIFVAVFEHGLLCDIEADGFRADSGTAYYYVMEKLEPLGSDDARRASRILVDLADIHAASKGPALEQAKKKFLFVKNRELKQEAKLQNQADGGDEWDETNIDGGITARAVDLFDRMTRAGMKHVDMNSNNVMQTKDGSLKLIDVESTYFVDG